MDPLFEEEEMINETQFPDAPSPDPDFCPPCSCSETIAQPRFSSPRTALPEAESMELERCIDVINGLLRTLGLSQGQAEEGGNQRALQRTFRNMRGTIVRVLVDGDSGPIRVVGLIHDAGRDYLQLDTVEALVLIPFSQLVTITHSPHSPVHEHREPELLNIDACFRRALVRNFSDVVSCSPELINLFFGLPLTHKFTSLTGSLVVVETGAKRSQRVRGTIISADDHSLQLQVKRGIRNLQLESIRLVRVL